MPAEPDHAAFMAGLHTLVERVNAGESRLPALSHLIDAARVALGAAGMTLTELTPDGGRVVAACGATAWAAGRPISVACQELNAGATGERTWEVPISALTSDLGQELSGRGLRRLLGTRVELDGCLLGGLHAFFGDPDEAASPAHHTMLSFVGSCAANLYGDGACLPAAGALALSFDKDLFIAVTSHELRTPVTVVKGFANTLDDHWDTLSPAERREAVRVIRQRADQLAQLVDRLLAAATATDPTGLPICTTFDLVTTLRETVDSFCPELRTRLRTNLPPALPKAYGDRATLPTVLAELVTNATKYSKDEVELRAAADEQTVLFQVTDRGIGIAPEHVEQAFVRYWQADPGDRREHPGVGLGLHLVRQIIERQKGWVSLRPLDSGGTVAEVRLLRADTTGLT